MARSKKKSNVNLSKMTYPIYVSLISDNPYGNSVIVNGLKITSTKKLIPSYEVMVKLKSIENYLSFEPIEVKESLKKESETNIDDEFKVTSEIKEIEMIEDVEKFEDEIGKLSDDVEC